MESISTKPEQVSATTADLAQQIPHTEVGNPLATSSDEDILVAGISTIELQTRRPTGAQRRKLTRETKMREGTWIEKPPKKTLSSQDSGAPRSSGGIKRPHSDSSTQSLEKQHPKKPRSTQVQTGLYKDAVVGIKMAVIHRLIRMSNWMKLKLL